MTTRENRRVLLVDDMAAIHEDFCKILNSSSRASGLDEAAAKLFGQPASAAASPLCFELDSAFQGAEALEKVHSAKMSGTPYAMAFIDMRMPPGWDGVETAERLWQADPRLQIVFCTAYSDTAWPEVLKRLDARDRLLILKKPFDPIEVYQFANALTTKWQMTEQAAFKMTLLEEAVKARTRELSNANIIVQNSPVILYRLRGEPSFPLIYVSENITKFGHDPKTLLASSDWALRLVHADDRPKVGAAMARMLETNAEGASIEFRLCARDGTLHWVENRYVPVRDKQGRLIQVEGIVIDITERKAAEEKIALMARTDGLTGLANRSTFLERLQQMFAAAKRGALPFAVHYLDLDRFKPVNDSLGHPSGDLLLQQVAARLKDCTRDGDLVARLGGDEFAILQCEVKEPANAGELAARILAKICLPFNLFSHEANISMSIGICPFAAEIPDAQAMLAQADVALYRSKEQGRNQYHFHSEALDQSVLARVTLAGELLRAIENQELELRYQPQVELSSGNLVRMEALVRWNHPTRGLLPPGAFIPIAEKTGIIASVGAWVLDQACGQMKAWRDEGLTPSVIAVNLSLHQLKHGSALIQEVTETLDKWGVPASNLEFDVAEATLAQLKWTQNDVLLQLRALGVKIAIDAFGSEYSSFDYIKEYRVNHLKLAPCYIQESALDSDSAAALRAILAFARDSGVTVLARGVETEEQNSLLKQTHSVTQAQGFHYGEAVSAERAAALLRQGSIHGRFQQT